MIYFDKVKMCRTIFSYFRLDPELEPFNALWSSEKASAAKKQRSRRSLVPEGAAAGDVFEAPTVDSEAADEPQDEGEFSDVDVPHDEQHSPIEWPIQLPPSADKASMESAKFTLVEENDDERVVRVSFDYESCRSVEKEDNFDIWHRR